MDTSVIAMDVNTAANQVYKINFGRNQNPRVRLQSRNICSLSVDELSRMQLDLLTASPPCQPFTRQGKQLDDQDARSDSFLHVIENVLHFLPNPPPAILVENVKGFERSRTRSLLVQTLRHRNYEIAEFLLQPNQFGVPNSRLRYFCLARQGYSGFCFDLQTIAHDIDVGGYLEQQHTLNEYPKYLSAKTCPSCVQQLFGSSAKRTLEGSWSIARDSLRSLNDYVTTLSTKQERKYLIPDVILLRYHAVFDIVDEQSQQSCCFTKNYGRNIKGAGSFLKANQNCSTQEVYEQVKRIKRLPVDVKSEKEKDEEILSNLKKLRLRYFTADEVARLMHFTNKLTFPTHFSDNQKYRLLGNSINVKVVGWLMRLLFCNQIDQ